VGGEPRPEAAADDPLQLNVWRDLAWHQTVGHARDWLSLSMLGEEAQGAIQAFLDSRRAKDEGGG
jgi:hypothetical protein